MAKINGIKPPVRDYSKEELRAILANPEIDFKTPDWVIGLRLKSRKNFNADVLPVIIKDCSKLITLEKYKRAKVIPARVVKIIFNKLL